MSTSKPAVLALEDGSIFRGLAFGADATIAGECVFNTSMTGYQEILTDPSYFGQIVTMTAVQIGNYGICPADSEAAGPKASGFVVRELSPIVSNWRSQLSLDAYLRQHGIAGVGDQIQILQGDDMGRPSLILLTIGGSQMQISGTGIQL